MALLQACDLWWDYLSGFGVLGFDGTCSLHIVRRKHDTQRKGHWPALGRSRDRIVDIVQQLDDSARGGDVGYRTHDGDSSMPVPSVASKRVDDRLLEGE